MAYTLHVGDCRDALHGMPDNSVDSVVCDPPYELGFMGKGWDSSGIAYSVPLWREVLRVLKPGGHLLAFSGTRTYHRMACAIEDAGFEIRDSIHWCYGSGFPKSLDVGKAIDKRRDDREQIVKVTRWIAATRDAAGKKNTDLDAAFGFAGMAGHWTSTKSQPAVPTLEQIPTLLSVLGLTLDEVPDEIRELIWTLNGNKGQPGKAWFEREVVAERTMIQGGGSALELRIGERREVRADITAPATAEAKQWDGWGSALKPAHEPVCVARKPLTGTIAANVLEWGTGALNVDAARIPSGGHVANTSPSHSTPQEGWDRPWRHEADASRRTYERKIEANEKARSLGRWPANLMLTHSPNCGDECVAGCPAKELDEQSGVTKSPSGMIRQGGDHFSIQSDKRTRGTKFQGHGDTGGASRFFMQTRYDETDFPPMLYYAKASTRERNAGCDSLPKKQVGTYAQDAWSRENMGNKPDSERAPAGNYHPTVKPVALMRHLVRLVTPPHGVVLDPFAGSGTTLVAAHLEGFDSIGCEMTEDYVPIIHARMTHVQASPQATAPLKRETTTEGQFVLF